MKPIITIRIPSRSIPGDWNDVEVLPNLKCRCNCLKNRTDKKRDFDSTCSHAKKALKILKRKRWEELVK